MNPRTISPGQLRPTHVVDCAGAFQGGAARFLRELDTYVSGRTPSITVIGRGRRLTPSWLIRREVRPDRPIRIALNNASFTLGKGRVVLLRNALHFATDQEFRDLNFRPSKELRLQTPVVRALATRAHHIVVPSATMGERVVKAVPSLADRISVRHHPISRPYSTREQTEQDSLIRILVPIVNAPYKRLDEHVTALFLALEGMGKQHQVLLTGKPSDYAPEIRGRRDVTFLGVIPSDELDSYWANATAVFYPPSLEAFGYPLAEARCHGIPVIAPNSALAREVAGGALLRYERGNLPSLQKAVSAVESVSLTPEPDSFDPNSYFEWLFSLGV